MLVRFGKRILGFDCSWGKVDFDISVFRFSIFFIL